MSEMLNAATQYAELGYAVFPCISGDKKPLTEHGCRDATLDIDRITGWWSTCPGANVAVATDGLVVIDVDGEVNKWLADEPEKLLELAQAPLALTPSGGRHYIFRAPKNKRYRGSASRLAPHVDVRADGNYIVVAPSVLSRGTRYQWVNPLDVPVESLPEPPAWLLAELDETPRVNTSAKASSVFGNPIPSGQRNSALTRLAGVMRRNGMSEAEMAAALHRANVDRCQPPLDAEDVDRIAASVARYEPNAVAVAQVEDHYAQDCEKKEANGPSDPGAVPDELLRVPGFVDEVMRHTLATAPYPESVMAFAGALALQAFLAGRKIRDTADNRTNLYLLGLANSGAGKDHPRKVNQQILLEIGYQQAVADGFASGEGIEDKLFLQPAMLFQTDEIDALLLAIQAGKDSRYEGIMQVLLKLCTSANGLYPLRVKAGKEHRVIDQPCLCLFGTAIPQHFYESLSSKMLTNGFLARQIVLEARRRGEGQEPAHLALPPNVVETARYWTDFRPGDRRGNLEHWHPQPKVVEATIEAKKAFRLFRASADERYTEAETRKDQAAMAIWARAHEKSRRSALVYAASVGHAAPLITADAATWACAFVDHQTRRMLYMASQHASESQFDARQKKVLRLIREAGEITRSELCRRTQSLSKRERDDAIENLRETGQIEERITETSGRPRLSYVAR
jgi:hypothetical protein